MKKQDTKQTKPTKQSKQIHLKVRSGIKAGSSRGKVIHA